jgi:hypothetical protein
MGAKYLPTIKDLKASQRFQQQQARQPRIKKPCGDQPTTQGKRSSPANAKRPGALGPA